MTSFRVRLSFGCLETDSILCIHMMPFYFYVIPSQYPRSCTSFTQPHVSSSQIVAYDGLLRSILGEITNVHLRDDTAWHQASLPIGAGGIGIRRAAQLAPSAFLASAAGCSDLVHQILPLQLRDVPDPTVEQALAIWQQDLEELPPSGTSACCQ